MAARHKRWLIAKGNVLLPSAATVAKLVERLRKEKWIGPGGLAVKTVEADTGATRTEPQPATMTKEWLDHADREEIRLVWEDGALCPLGQKAARWALEAHRAPEYVYPRA